MATFEAIRISEKALLNPIMGMHLKAFYFFGIFCSKESKYPRFHFVRAIALTLILGSSSILMLSKRLKQLDNITSQSLTLASGLFFLSAAVLMLNLLVQRQRLANVMNFLENDFNITIAQSDDEEQQILAKTVKDIRRLNWGVQLPSMFGVAVSMLECIVCSILTPNYLMDLNRSPIILHRIFPLREIQNTVFIGQICPWICVIVATAFVPLCYTLTPQLMKYVIYRYEILIKRMSQMEISKVMPCPNKCDTIKRLSDDELNYWRLQLCAYCVRTQNMMRWFVAELNILLNISVFFDFVSFSVIICCCFYDLAVNEQPTFDAIVLVMCLLVQSIIIYSYHSNATLLADCNEMFSYGIYCSNWYQYPLRVQKTLLIMMIGTMQPFTLKALFVELKMDTFIRIIRGSISYFGVMKELNEK